MPLQKQTYAISLAAGVDTKTDPKQVVAGKLLVLENGIFTSRNRIRKRDGFSPLSQDIVGGGGTISNGQGLATYLDELLLWNGSSLYSYSQVDDVWSNRGSFVSVHAELEPVVRNTYTQIAQDCAVHESGMKCFAWEDSSGGVRYSVIDSTGLNLVHDQQVAATGTRPKILACGNFLSIFYVGSDTRLYVFPIQVGSPTTVPTPTAVTPTSGTQDAALNDVDVAYDVEHIETVGGHYGFLAYNNQRSGGGITIVRFPPGGPASPDQTVNSTLDGCQAIGVFQDAVDMQPSLAYATTGSVKFQTYDYQLTTRINSGTIEAISGVFNVGGCCIGAGSTSHMQVFYTVTASLSENFYVRHNTFTTAGGAGTPNTVLRSVGMSGKPFAYGSRAFVPVCHQSPTGTNLQTTYFLADSSGSVATKVLYGLAGGIPTRNTLAESNDLGSGKFQMSLLARQSLQVADGIVFSQTGVEEVLLDFEDETHSFLRAELGENLHIGGGFITMYDGVSPVEHGFHVFPEGVTCAPQGSGGSLSSGTYQYVATYEWLDNRGQQHRSAPSPAVSVNTVASDKVIVTVPTLRVTNKQSPRSPVQVIVYRTVVNAPPAANGSQPLFFRVTSLTSPTLNDPTVDTVTFTDTTSDTTLVGNAPLYTNGGVVENIAAPPVTSILVHKNRLFAIDSTSPSTLWFTKEVIPGTRAVEGAPVEFSDLFTIAVDPRGGDATALGSLDDNLVVFKSNSIFIISGDGPTAAGAGGWNNPQLVTTDAGCTDQRSVVITPNGLMFQSSKGIYLLDRGLNVRYIGADVEAYNSDTVTSAILVPTTNQVRFTLSSGVCLIYDYLYQQWSVFTNVAAADSAIFQNKHAFILSNGQVRVETPGVYSDAGRAIKLKLVTGWLQFAGVQGFQRVYKALILGEYNSPHKLQTSVAFDFNPAKVQVDTFDTVALLNPQTYGSETPYGGQPTPYNFGLGPFGSSSFGSDPNATTSIYGGAWLPYQFRVFMSQQKCQAVQLTLEDVQTSPGEGLSLSAISLEVGVKRGLKKVPAGVSG